MLTGFNPQQWGWVCGGVSFGDLNMLPAVSHSNATASHSGKLLQLGTCPWPSAVNSTHHTAGTSAPKNLMLLRVWKWIGESTFTLKLCTPHTNYEHFQFCHHVILKSPMWVHFESRTKNKTQEFNITPLSSVLLAFTMISFCISRRLTIQLYNVEAQPQRHLPTS